MATNNPYAILQVGSHMILATKGMFGAQNAKHAITYPYGLRKI
jgi:hypothetical protein